jgi:hypothetical protein
MSASDDQHPAEPPHPARTPADPPRQAAIDVERLTEKVYQLLLAEARLARVRHERRDQ